MDIISLKLPFAMKERVNLYKAGDNLLVEVGHYRRSISSRPPSRGRSRARRSSRMARLLIMFKGDEDGRRGKR